MLKTANELKQQGAKRIFVALNTTIELDDIKFWKNDEREVDFMHIGMGSVFEIHVGKEILFIPQQQVKYVRLQYIE